MILIPYSDLVHYYYANMKNLISYTRSYARRCESWKYALMDRMKVCLERINNRDYNLN